MQETHPWSLFNTGSKYEEELDSSFSECSSTLADEPNVSRIFLMIFFFFHVLELQRVAGLKSAMFKRVRFASHVCIIPSRFFSSPRLDFAARRTRRLIHTTPC